MTGPETTEWLVLRELIGLIAGMHDISEGVRVSVITGIQNYWEMRNVGLELAAASELSPPLTCTCRKGATAAAKDHAEACPEHCPF